MNPASPTPTPSKLRPVGAGADASSSRSPSELVHRGRHFSSEASDASVPDERSSEPSPDRSAACRATSRCEPPLTGRKICGGPLYGTAAGSNACGRSAGFLSSLIAPPGCDRDFIPRVDASRVSQRDERIVCVLLSGCAPCEGEQGKHPCREEQERCGEDSEVKESCGAWSFCFHSGDLWRRDTNRSPADHPPVM